MPLSITEHDEINAERNKRISLILIVRIISTLIESSQEFILEWVQESLIFCQAFLYDG
jgi:hypothetical protein